MAVASTFDLPSDGVDLSHQQLLLVLQDLKLGVVQFALGFVKLQLQLVQRVPLLAVRGGTGRQALQLGRKDTQVIGRRSWVSLVITTISRANDINIHITTWLRSSSN